MSNYKILADSSCDLSDDLIENYDIDIIPYYITFDGVNYYREGVDITHEELYKKMREGMFPKTSLPPVQDYIDKFRVHVEQGRDIICVCLTSKFSGAYQCAITSAEILKEEFPDRKIHVIDSRLATTLEGSLVIQVAEMNKQGLSIEEIFEKAGKAIDKTKALFTVSTLDYLQRGGRIGKVSALAGNLLNIKPIIVLEDGELLPHSKTMGRKKSISEMRNIFHEDMKDKKEDYYYNVLHSDALDEAIKFKKSLEDLGYEIDEPIKSIGATIGVHAGPGVVGIACNKKIDI